MKRPFTLQWKPRTAIGWVAIAACTIIVTTWAISLRYEFCIGWGLFLTLGDGQLTIWDGSFLSGPHGFWGYVERINSDTHDLDDLTYGLSWLDAVEDCGIGARTLGSVPLWILLLPWAGLAALVQMRLRRYSPACCLECGYNLTGNASGICPECGTPVAPVEDSALHPDDAGPGYRRRTKIAIIAIGSLPLLASMALLAAGAHGPTLLHAGQGCRNYAALIGGTNWMGRGQLPKEMWRGLAEPGSYIGAPEACQKSRFYDFAMRGSRGEWILASSRRGFAFATVVHARVLFDTCRLPVYDGFWRSKLYVPHLASCGVSTAFLLYAIGFCRRGPWFVSGFVRKQLAIRPPADRDDVCLAILQGCCSVVFIGEHWFQHSGLKYWRDVPFYTACFTAAILLGTVVAQLTRVLQPAGNRLSAVSLCSFWASVVVVVGGVAPFASRVVRTYCG